MAYEDILSRMDFLRRAAAIFAAIVGAVWVPACNGRGASSSVTAPATSTSSLASTPMPPGGIAIPLGQVPAALLSARNWITFEPPAPFNPGVVSASSSLLTTSLGELVKEGWRGLVTYSLDPDQGLDQVPAIARQVGFVKVIAGLFVFDEDQFQRERAAALAQAALIDGFVLGNEVVSRNVAGWDRTRLINEMASLRADTGKPVTTSEVFAQYDATLLAAGDWVFPNLQFWFDPSIRTPAVAVRSVANQVQSLRSAAPGRIVVVKESWWPTAGDPAATQANQSEFFRELSATGLPFVWGEAFDQFWKSEPLGQGPNWGLHTSGGPPKDIIASVRSTYTGVY